MPPTLTFRAEPVWLMGDTHGIFNATKSLGDIPKGATVIHLGDLGVGFQSEAREIANFAHLDLTLQEREQRMYVIRGNHDSPGAFPSYPTDRIALMEDYTSIMLPDSRTVLCVGGAISIDRCLRQSGKDYWSGERTVLKKCSPHDVLLLHDAPSYHNKTSASLSESFPSFCARDPELIRDCEAQRLVIDQVKQACKPSSIFGGHYHNSVQEGIYRCLAEYEVLPLFQPT